MGGEGRGVDVGVQRQTVVSQFYQLDRLVVEGGRAVSFALSSFSFSFSRSFFLGRWGLIFVGEAEWREGGYCEADDGVRGAFFFFLFLGFSHMLEWRLWWREGGDPAAGSVGDISICHGVLGMESLAEFEVGIITRHRSIYRWSLLR